uniref:Isoform 2 of Caveolae-associated protein 1 n=1 Tax=Homo sapiens TaxID=9606 RepID=Q6NZI2-2|nr:PTRF protein [Homo sapiens]
MEDPTLYIVERPLPGYPDAEAPEPSSAGAQAAEEPSGAGSEELIKSDQVNGVLVLSLLDKIIGAVDQIQLTQAQLEERQAEMEGAVQSIQGELSKLGEGERPEEDAAALELSSDEAVEVEEVIEESRAERIKRSGLRRVDDFKKAFSKEKMEKTKVRTRENLEKTRLKTKENLEKTRHTLEKRMNKLGTRLVPAERREKLKTSRDKLRKSFTPDHVVYARSKTAVYKVPPFTFHVKKIREGQVEVLKATEMVEVGADDDEGGAERGEAGDLRRGSSPDVHALLEITEESDAVLVDKSDSD